MIIAKRPVSIYDFKAFGLPLKPRETNTEKVAKK